MSGVATPTAVLRALLLSKAALQDAHHGVCNSTDPRADVESAYAEALSYVNGVLGFRDAEVVPSDVLVARAQALTFSVSNFSNAELDFIRSMADVHLDGEPDHEVATAIADKVRPWLGSGS